MEFKDVPEVLDKLLDRVSALEAICRQNGFAVPGDTVKTEPNIGADLPPVLEVKDIMTYLGTSRSSATTLMHDPKMKSFKAGGRLRVTRSNFVSWIESGQQV